MSLAEVAHLLDDTNSQSSDDESDESDECEYEERDGLLGNRRRLVADEEDEEPLPATWPLAGAGTGSNQSRESQGRDREHIDGGHGGVGGGAEESNVDDDDDDVGYRVFFEGTAAADYIRKVAGDSAIICPLGPLGCAEGDARAAKDALHDDAIADADDAAPRHSGTAAHVRESLQLSGGWISILCAPALLVAAHQQHRDSPCVSAVAAEVQTLLLNSTCCPNARTPADCGGGASESPDAGRGLDACLDNPRPSVANVAHVLRCSQTVCWVGSVCFAAPAVAICAYLIVLLGATSTSHALVMLATVLLCFCCLSYCVAAIIALQWQASIVAEFAGLYGDVKQLLLELDSFDDVLFRCIRMIKELVLVANGYRLASEIASVSRLERRDTMLHFKPFRRLLMNCLQAHQDAFLWASEQIMNHRLQPFTGSTLFQYPSAPVCDLRDALSLEEMLRATRAMFVGRDVCLRQWASALEPRPRPEPPVLYSRSPVLREREHCARTMFACVKVLHVRLETDKLRLEAARHSPQGHVRQLHGQRGQVGQTAHLLKVLQHRVRSGLARIILAQSRTSGSADDLMADAKYVFNCLRESLKTCKAMYKDAAAQRRSARKAAQKNIGTREPAERTLIAGREPHAVMGGTVIDSELATAMATPLPTMGVFKGEGTATFATRKSKPNLFSDDADSGHRVRAVGQHMIVELKSVLRERPVKDDSFEDDDDNNNDDDDDDDGEEKEEEDILMDVVGRRCDKGEKDLEELSSRRPVVRDASAFLTAATAAAAAAAAARAFASSAGTAVVADFDGENLIL